MEEVQLGFLRLLSTRVSQKFTYYCSNSIAVLNAQDNTYDLAMRLLGENDHEFKTEKLGRDEVDDGCKVGTSHNTYTCHLIHMVQIVYIYIYI